MEWIIGIVGLLIGLAIRHFGASYFGEKGKNLATKQDIGRITELVESVKSDFSKDLELLKWQLTKKANIHRIVAEREVQAISEIGSVLFDLRLATSSLRPVFDRLPQGNEASKAVFQQRFSKWAETHDSFFSILEKQRLFLPKVIYQMLWEIKSYAVEEGVSFETDFRHFYDESFTFEQYEKAIERVNKLLTAIDDLREVINKRYEIEWS